MIVLAGVAIAVLVVVGVVAAIAVAAMGSEGRSSGSSLGVAAIVGGGLLAVLLVLAVGVAVLGVGGGGARGAADESAPARTPTTTEVEAPLERAIEGVRASYDGFVALDASGTELLVPRVVRGVEDGDVVEVSGRGFAARSGGVLAQCDGTAARKCSNVVDVQTDIDGAFRVAYRLAADAAGTALLVDIDGDRRTAVLDFGSAAPWPVSKVEGEELVVTGAPTTGLALARCPGDAVDLDRCTTVDRGSASTTRFELPRSRTDDVLVLLDGAGTVLAAPLGFREGDAVDVAISPGRLVLGLGFAVVLLAVAVWLVRRTDWRAPAEATAGFDA